MIDAKRDGNYMMIKEAILASSPYKSPKNIQAFTHLIQNGDKDGYELTDDDKEIIPYIQAAVEYFDDTDILDSEFLNDQKNRDGFIADKALTLYNHTSSFKDHPIFIALVGELRYNMEMDGEKEFSPYDGAERQESGSRGGDGFQGAEELRRSRSNSRDGGVEESKGREVS